MKFMKWDEKLSVNITEIDEQHKKLFDMLSNFYNALNTDKNRALGELIDSVIDYSKYHFETEEKYMERFDYPKTAEHKKEHQLFIDKVLDVKKRFREGSQVLTLEVTNFLKDWIIKHVSGEDKDYSHFFNERGLH